MKHHHARGPEETVCDLPPVVPTEAGDINRAPLGKFSLAPKASGSLPAIALSHAADKDGRDGMDSRIETGLDPPLNPPHVGAGSLQILIAGEEQGYIDGNTGEYGVFNRGESFRSSGNLDEQIRPVRRSA